LAKRKQTTPAEFQKRILELESIYGTKKLGDKLGVSRDSIRRYRTGKTTPQDRELYKKVNRIYGQKKKEVIPEKVEKIKKQQAERSKAQKLGRIKNQYAPIYPDYMYDSPAADFTEVKDFLEKFEELFDNGYVAGWRGRDSEGIPLEVMFLSEGIRPSLKRFGRFVNVVTLFNEYTDKAMEDITSKRPGTNIDKQSIRIFRHYYKEIPGLINAKKLKFEERMDLIREFILSIKLQKGQVSALLGYYFDEGDIL